MKNVADRPITLTLTRAELVGLLGALSTTAALGRYGEGEAGVAVKLADALKADTRELFVQKAA